MIYVFELWMEQFEVMVVCELDVGGLFLEVLNVGMKYFLEVSIVQEFVEDWFVLLDEQLMFLVVCWCVVDYVINDVQEMLWLVICVMMVSCCFGFLSCMC